MEIIVGRDEKTRKLRVNVDGKQGLYGQPNSVPLEVSRQHLSLTDKGDGKWKIKNLNDQNVTYVNGVAIESKVVSEKDKIELGSSRYALQWSLFSLPKNETVDIRHLKAVWEKYEEVKKEIAITDKKFQVARSGTGIITMAAIICGFTIGQGPIYYVIYAIAICLSVIFLLVAWSRTEKTPEILEQAKKEFKMKYVCPKCGRYIKDEYDLIEEGDSCKFCKSKFKK